MLSFNYLDNSLDLTGRQAALRSRCVDTRANSRVYVRRFMTEVTNATRAQVRASTNFKSQVGGGSAIVKE